MQRNVESPIGCWEEELEKGYEGVGGKTAFWLYGIPSILYNLREQEEKCGRILLRWG